MVKATTKQNAKEGVKENPKDKKKIVEKPVIKVDSKTKLSARVNSQLVLLLKLGYLHLGVSMESRIEELLKRDLENLLKTQWYREKLQGNYFEMVAKKLESGKVGDADSGTSADDQFGMDWVKEDGNDLV